MEASPHSIPEIHHVDFRAPPPSPIASGRRSSFANDTVLTEYLENSLRVPDLILPDRIFPSQKILETPQVVDFQSLQNGDFTRRLGCDMDRLARLGCFQLVNYGISSESVMSAMDLAQDIFNVPVEKRAMVMVSTEKPYGFEEEIIQHGDDDDKEEIISNSWSEEFVWCRDESLRLEMEAILGDSYSKFSVKMEALMSNIEAVGERLLGVVRQEMMKLESPANDHQNEMVMQLDEEEEEDKDDLGRVAELLSCCYLRKHRRNVPAERWERSLRYDVIKMLIRGSDHSHALCFHICNASSSEFHVYSKKGWISFSPEKDALVVTIGDQIQAMSNRHVLGRPMIKSGEEEEEDSPNSTSMAFMYSPPPPTINSSGNNQMKEEITISIKQQAMVALVFSLVCQFLAFLYKFF